MSFGAIAGAIAGGIASGGAQSAFGLYSASKAWRREREAMQHRHQWEVNDLRKAGLNPILSAGGSGTPGGSASIPASPNFDFLNSALGLQQMQTEEAKKDALDEQGQLTNAETTKTSLENEMIRGTIKSRIALENANNRLNAAKAIYYSNHPMLWKTQAVANSAQSVGDAIGSFNPFGKILGTVKDIFSKTPRRAGF